MRRKTFGFADGAGRNRMWGLRKRWPRALSNIWLQNIGFLFLCVFSVPLLTRPFVSVVVLGGLIVLATALHIVYRHRAFCSYVCPVSGFLSHIWIAAMQAQLRSSPPPAACPAWPTWPSRPRPRW